MQSLIDTIRSYGGLAATHQLLAAGFNKRVLSFAANHDIIIRVRQGWYCTPDVGQQLQQAIRVGGRLGCISGAALHGMWAPPDEHLHVSLPHNACRLRTPHDMRRRLRPNAAGFTAGVTAGGAAAVTTHWNSIPKLGSRLLLDPISCLAEVIRCQPVGYAVAIADSALRPSKANSAALVSRSEWQVLADRFPGRARVLNLADGVCESGTESITWVRLSPHKLPLRRQVWIDGKRVDFLIGRRLVVEVDGAAYHIDPVRFEADRARDAQLAAINYIVFRFSYVQVMYRWAEVELAILAAVARCDHL